MIVKKIIISLSIIFLICTLISCGVVAILYKDIQSANLFGDKDKPSYNDKMMAHQMTQAVEQFDCEYAMYCRDVKMKTINFNKMDDMQKRVYNITSAKTMEDIKVFEKLQLDKSTKHIKNKENLKKMFEEYILNETLYYSPTQPEYSFWYSYECGTIVVSKTDSTIKELNSLIPNKTTSNGNPLTSDTNWINLSA